MINEEPNKFFRYINNCVELLTKTKQINFSNPKGSTRDMFISFEPNRRLVPTNEFSPRDAEHTNIGVGAYTENRSDQPRKYENLLQTASDRFADFDANRLKADFGRPSHGSHTNISSFDKNSYKNANVNVNTSK